MAVVWCPDWPVVAWGIPLDEPAVVVVANRVIACSPAARAEGVSVGLRRRDAQGRCPDVAVLDRDVDRESRLFEPLAIALEALTPHVEIRGPGLLGFPTRGPSRFFGGDEAMADETLAVVLPVLANRGSCRVGVADGAFTARLAARSERAIDGPRIVDPGESAAFLAGLPIAELQSAQTPTADLIDVLGRLGLSTLGAFAALNPADVVGRFGQEGQIAHRLARGEDEHPPDLRRPAPDLAVTWAFEPAADRIDRCAFAAKALADELHASLSSNGLACVRVGIEAETESGEQHLRLWRHDGALSAAALAERARWQLDGWLHLTRMMRQSARERPETADLRGTAPGGSDGLRGTSPGGSNRHDDWTQEIPDDIGVGAGIARLTLIPDEVVPASGRQLGFWGGRAERADDVTRAVGRLQGLLGPEAVTVPEWRGGRGPGEQIALIPAAAVDLGEERVATARQWIDEPWPGSVPQPAPAMVLADPIPLTIIDAAGGVVGVTGRGEITANPARVSGLNGPTAQAIHRQAGSKRGSRSVTAWAGPWPADERWWDVMSHRRRARMQLTLDDGSAHLVVIEDGEWWLEATYD